MIVSDVVVVRRVLQISIVLSRPAPLLFLRLLPRHEGAERLQPHRTHTVHFTKSFQECTVAEELDNTFRNKMEIFGKFLNDLSVIITLQKFHCIAFFWLSVLSILL